MIVKVYAVALGILSCSTVALAEEPPPPAPVEPAKPEPPKKEEPKGWWQGITFNAFAAVGYSYNLSNPENKLNQYRSFDYDHNTFRLDGAELVVQKAVANPGEFG